MAKPKAGLYSAQKRKIYMEGVRDLASIIIGSLLMPRGYYWLPVGGNE
jgi:hypothetical protein